MWRRRRGADRPPFPTWRRGPFSFGDPQKITLYFTDLTLAG
ncbi:Uncharacterised protein [Bordetella pertussis]|nr:Uncharacterised protein [Bordetella pertussis]